VPVRLRVDLGAVDRGSGRCHGAGAHRAGGAQAQPEVAGPRTDPVRTTAAAARSGRAVLGQRGRHPGAAAGRLDRPGIAARWHPDRRRQRCTGQPARVGGLKPMTPTYYLVLSAALFSIGAVGVLIRRNAIVVFMCVELMLNAVNLTLVTFSRINGSLDGQIMAFFVMVVAAAEVVVGLAIIMSIFRTRRSASVDDA